MDDGSGSAVRALVCDGDELGARTVEQVLADHDVEVVATVGTAAHALEAGRHTRPELVLLRHELPGMGDGQAVRALGDLPGPPEVIVVASTREVAESPPPAGAAAAVALADPAAIGEAVAAAVHRITTGDRRGRGDRRSGEDRRKAQDWSKVFAERRSGVDRRQRDRRTESDQRAEPQADDG